MKDGNISDDLERLLDHLKTSRGFDFGAYKRSTLSRRIERRMASLGVESPSSYLDYLQVHQDEFRHLFNSILINVTSFFRDPEAWEFVRGEIVPKDIISSERSEGHIRIWSAGCSSGEECYSVAILFAEAMGSDAFRDRVKIYATDVDEEALATARVATYTDKQTEGVPLDLREKYFDQVNHRWGFKKDLRRSVIFGRHDLLDDAPISHVDLLLCRNTLVYFNHEAQAKIVNRFHYALREDGFLVLGKAEMLLNFVGAFAPVDLKQRVLAKVRVDNGAERLLTGYPEREERVPQTGPPARLREISFDQDPTAQFVVDSKSHLLLVNERAREWFGLTPRDLGRPLQDLEVSYRPVELRSYLDEAHSRRQVVQLREVSWPTPGGEPRYFNVHVTPIVDSTDTPLGSKIIFTEVTRQHELQEQLERSRQELETAYEELQSTNDELETTNEELQSTVEELETTNEELQSTNEELETMNEELQSTNEELETVNQELRQRGTDLSRSNVFLRGILRTVQAWAADSRQGSVRQHRSSGASQGHHRPDAGDTARRAWADPPLIAMAPTGVSHRINAERMVLVGWLRALLLQIAHPLIAAGVTDHSSFRANSAAKFGRLRQTIEAMLHITFGTVHEREQAIEGIRTIHRRVHGTLGAPCGVYPAGTPYSAEDPALVVWVHATLVESVVLTFEQIVGPLAPSERDEYCADSADVAIELGAKPEATPRSWDALRAYLAERYASGEIVVGDQARLLSSALLMAAPGWLGTSVVRPVMSLVAAGMLPPHIRIAYELRWTSSRSKVFHGAIGFLRCLRRISPDRAALWGVARSRSCRPRGRHLVELKELCRRE